MRTTTIITAGLILLSGFSLAQDDDMNLVQNGGFETLDGRLRKEKQIDIAKYWVSPTGLSADLYHGDVKPETGIGTPDNNMGSEEPAEGVAYAGVRMYSYNNKEIRTYIMTELLGPLKKDVEYCVSFKVNLAERSKYACNNIAGYLSKKPFETEERVSLLMEDAEIKHSKNKIFNQTYNWETVCHIYKANGGEKFLTIGNFDTDGDTKYDKMRKPKTLRGAQSYDAYYFIDDVQVFQLDSVEQCQCEQTDISKDEIETIYVKQIISKKELTTDELIDASTLYFADNSRDLTAVAKKELDLLAARMQEEPALKLVIHGHSDAEEVEAGKMNPLNKYTAQKRVNEVLSYMEGKGISKDRFTTEIHDDNDPADTSDTGIGHAKNRRVEFTKQ